MYPYLAQFREEGQRFFKNGCGFHDVEDAQRYVRLVMDALDWIAEGRVIDAQSGDCLHHSAAERQVRAIFGEPQGFEDVNGSGGVDDDPFVKYAGPDDPEIRYR